jgi:hypothetical protein
MGFDASRVIRVFRGLIQRNLMTKILIILVIGAAFISYREHSREKTAPMPAAVFSPPEAGVRQAGGHRLGNRAGFLTPRRKGRSERHQILHPRGCLLKSLQPSALSASRRLNRNDLV